MVTPLTDLSPTSIFFSANYFWIEEIGETTFTIKIKRKTGHDIEFAWSYQEC